MSISVALCPITLVPLPPTPAEAGLRLHLPAHAGGGLSLFHGWRKELLPDIGLARCCCPAGKAGCTNPNFEMSRLVRLWPLPTSSRAVGPPLRLFGTSLGGLTLELAPELARAAAAAPPSLLPAATRPHLPTWSHLSAHLLDDAFSGRSGQALRPYPPEVQAHAQAAGAVAAHARADLGALWRHTPSGPRHPRPWPRRIIAVAGQQDELGRIREDARPVGSNHTASFTQQLLP